MTTPTPTPCSIPECNADGTGEPCATHEREQSHAEGEHELCGSECDAGLRQRIAEALAEHRANWSTHVPTEHACCAAAVLPLVAEARAAAVREVLAAIEDPTRRQQAAAHFDMASDLGWESARDVVRLMIDPSTPGVPSVRCPDCHHQTCDGDGPCGAIVGVSVVSEARCRCTTGAPNRLRARAGAVHQDGQP